MKDGAHTHGHGGGGLGVAVAVIVGLGVVEAIARVWPYVVAGVAVIAGLWAAGWITHTVMAYRCQQAAWYAQMTSTAHDDPREVEIAALRQAVADLHARLVLADSWAWPGAERHEHVHFHGLAAEQVAAVLAVRQQDRPQDRGVQR